MIIKCSICNEDKEIKESLTFKEIKVLQFIINYIKKNNISPSVRDIAKGLNLKSVSNIDRYVYRLQDKNYIAKTPYIKRSIVVLKEIICG